MNSLPSRTTKLPNFSLRLLAPLMATVLTACGGADGTAPVEDGMSQALARRIKPPRDTTPIPAPTEPAPTPTPTTPIEPEPAPAPAPAPEPTPTPTPTPTSPVDPAPAGTCTATASPAKPADALDVRTFGALPDDGRDDTTAIQTALNALKPGQWLVFPAGTYLHARRLDVRVPGSVLWSEGATLKGTNPQDQAVMLSADGASIYNFTLTAVTGTRLHAPWQSRIAIFDRVDRPTHLVGNVIRGNRVINGGEPGTALANGASSAGIFVFRADNFLVDGNEVRRSLSDGIHVTGGSRNGRVINNTVRETGDDMIAMVSYLKSGDWMTETAASLSTTFAADRDLQRVRNVLVSNNDVEGQYWGRGISVVGGADITIRKNRIARTTLAAGVLIARETSYVTWGVSNVLVQGNTITDVQTTVPAYTPVGWPTTVSRTYHGGIEIHGFIFDDERKLDALASAVAVKDVVIDSNSVTGTLGDGVRIGEGTGQVTTMTGVRADGATVSRASSGGFVGKVSLRTLALSNTGLKALEIKTQPTTDMNVHCEAVTSQGVALSNANCFGTAPAVSGSAMTCSGA